MSTEAPSTLSLDEAAEILERPGSPFEVGRTAIGGVEYNVFIHAPRTLAALYEASLRHADRTFVVYEDERYTFAEVRARAASLARYLSTSLGVRKGDRVVLAMRNLPEWVVAYMAVTALGAVIVPLNAWWQGPELSYGIQNSGAKVAIVDDERLGRLLPHLPTLGVHLLAARPRGELPADVEPLGPLLQGGGSMPDAGVSPEDDATIMYTSGSTAHPKGVVSTQRAVATAVFNWEFAGIATLLSAFPALLPMIEPWLARGAEALNEAPFELPQMAGLVTLPLFHVTGCNVQFLPAYRGGRKLVMMRKWNAGTALELIEREKVTDFGGVPTMAWELVNHPDFGKRDVSSLLRISSGGAARPPDQVAKTRDKLPVRQGSGYGMTETNSIGAAISGDDYLARPDSIGRAVPPLMELRIVGHDGSVLPPNSEGEICMKGPMNMRGYWNEPAATAATLRDGWVHSGDLGRLDPDGFLYITGRAKEIVIRGGENISTNEVEHVLYTHPAVFEVAVYGVPDERLGEALAATVMLREDATATPEELRAHVAASLARFKVPEHVWVQSEPLPRVGSGKIDKRSLKERARTRAE